MSDDIEQFLSRAAQRRRARTTPPARPAQQPPKVRDVEIVEAQPAPPDPPAPSVAQLASRRLQTSGFDERTAQLGERVGQADDVLEAHLHDKFDHRVGRLSDSFDYDTAGQDSQAEGGFARLVAEMLRSPQDSRLAVILGEILQRPDQRW